MSRINMPKRRNSAEDEGTQPTRKRRSERKNLDPQKLDDGMIDCLFLHSIPYLQGEKLRTLAAVNKKFAMKMKEALVTTRTKHGKNETVVRCVYEVQYAPAVLYVDGIASYMG